MAVIPVVVAQTRRQPSDFQTAARALNEGRYAEVTSTLEKLDARDPAVAALIGRALIAQGKYADAETALRAGADRAVTGDAALELGLLLKMLGKPEADAHLARVAAMAVSVTGSSELARAARALRSLGRFQEANAAYRDAASIGTRDAAINTAWGELFLEKYNKAEALRSFKIALLVDPRYVPALLGAARALADDNPPEAVSNAKTALKVNPNSADAHAFLALRELDSGKRDEAKAALAKALEINPSHLEARAQLASIAFIEDRRADFDAEVAKVLAVAPTYGEVFRVAAEAAAGSFRYEDAAVLAKRAVALAPQNSRVLGDLGIHLLRVGDEPGARKALDAAFKMDPFDVITFNLLQMLDTLDKFVTSESGNLVLRLHKDEAPVLQEYAMSLSAQALATLSKRYGFTPAGPILVEMFPKHDDFAVRNLGLPGMVGALGACFGRVVTLDSPKARPPGDFQWEATLWHELAHVITLQMSKYRVPRWLTEGISVYEETLARPEWGRGQDIQFAQMINDGSVLKLKDLNSGFTDPRLISISYFQASLVVEHIVAVHGDEGLHRLLRAYAEGLETEAALKKALDTDFDTLQTGFDALIEKRFGGIRKALVLPEKGIELQRMLPPAIKEYIAQHPDSFLGYVALGSALRKAGNTDEALAAFEKAVALVPMAKGPTSPNTQIVELALEKKDNGRAIRALRDIVRYDFDNVAAARQLVDLLKQSGVEDDAQLGPLYQRIAAIDPFDQSARRALGQFAMKRSDYDAASREFRTVLALVPVDKAAAHTDLAESYLAGGKRPEARRQTLAALEIAPSYERAQDLLLKLAGDRR